VSATYTSSNNENLLSEHLVLRYKVAHLHFVLAPGASAATAATTTTTTTTTTTDDDDDALPKMLRAGQQAGDDEQITIKSPYK